MPEANVLAKGQGFVMAAIGVLGVVAPSILLELGRSLQSPGALYLVAAIRVGFGIILFWAAPNSRTPRTFRILGIVIIIAGLVAPFFGVDRARAMFDWWSTHGTFVTRAGPLAAVLFGLFIAYSTRSRGS